MESNIEDMEGDFEDIEIRMTNLEHTLKEQVKEQIESITKEMGHTTPRSTSNFSQHAANEYHYHGQRAVTAVIGNLDNFESLQAVSAYIRDELNKLSGPISTNVHSK
eukprot:222256-Pyramimonas_sp.AAC.1